MLGPQNTSSSSVTASYTDTNATNGTTYNYYVVAYNLNSAPSTQSATVTATPTAVAPAAPAAVVASPGDAQVAGDGLEDASGVGASIRTGCSGIAR